MTRSLVKWLMARRWLLLAAALTVALGLASRALLHGPPAKVIGVALYATLIYWLVRAAYPRPSHADASGTSSRPPTRALSFAIPASLALAISWAVEFLQLTPISAKLSATHPVLRLIFGEVFSTTDLIWYALGVAAGVLIDFIIQRRISSPRT